MKINSQLKERILNTENKKGEFKIMNDELLKKQLNNIYGLGYKYLPNDVLLTDDEVKELLKNIKTSPYKITNIKMIVENKVVEVTFFDGIKEKMVLVEPDEFSMEDCLYIALAKKLYKNDYTFEGIEHKSKELRYMKKYVKIVNDGLKLWKQIQKKEAEEKEIQEMIQRKRKKRAEYKIRRAERKRNEKINLIAEAIKRSGVESIKVDDGK